MKKHDRFTRGKGLCEGILAKIRFDTTNRLIPSDKREGRILDIGCGYKPHFLSRTRFACKYGLDKIVDEDYVRYLHKFNTYIVSLDLEKTRILPYEENFFDIVTMLAVFEHIEPDKLDDILREIYRILKPNGALIITTPAFWTESLQKCLAMLGLISKEELNEHKDIYSHEKITSYLTKSGFKKNNIDFGFFEIYMNSWTYAVKS